MLWLVTHRLAPLLTLAVLAGGAAVSALFDVPMPDGSGLLFAGAVLIAAGDRLTDRRDWMGELEAKARAAGLTEGADDLERYRQKRIRWHLIIGAAVMVAGLVQLVVSLFD